jgi:hypothetical protein
MCNIKISCTLFFIIIGASLFSQTQFEGKITYKLTTDKIVDSNIIEVYYGKQKIIGIMKRNNATNGRKESILIDFTKGLISRINTERKNFQTDSLIRRMNKSVRQTFIKTGKTDNILNQHCSEYTFANTAKTEDLENMHYLFWYADSLDFSVQGNLPITSDLFLFTNGQKVGMGLKINDIKHNDKFELHPISIDTFSPPDTIFEIPVDYQVVKNIDSIPNDGVADSVAKYSPPVVKLPKKVPLPTNKKKLIPKAAATYRKE